MKIPTEPIGSIPRPPKLIAAIEKAGDFEDPSLEPLYHEAIRDTIQQFEATGSPIITDGEQRKYHNFWTYSVQGSPNTAPDGFKIPFSAGHVRRMPRLTAGPFRYRVYADRYVEAARRYAHLPLKQAVISPSALSLMYPAEDIPGFTRQEFIDELLREHETEIRRCFEKGAQKVQIDFTEGRLALKLDHTGELLNSFIGLNNLALSRFSAEERQRIGVHTCPGGDRDSTHSAEIDYEDLLPRLFELRVGSFYISLAGETDRPHVLKIIRQYLKADQRAFVGVISPIDPRVDSQEEVRDRVLEAAEYIPLEQLGTTDDCGFSPFSDDTSTSRETAFAKIRARVEGTRLAERILGRETGKGIRPSVENEEKLLRSVAQQNAQAVFLAREQSERELLAAKDALERKSAELVELNRLLSEAHNDLEKRVQERTAELKSANEELRNLSSRLLRLQDDERRRLARELHDSVGQIIAALGLNIAVVQSQSHKLDELGARAVSENAHLLDQASQEIRTISYLLHPPLLEVAGLASALQWYVDGFSERSHIKVEMEIPSEFDRLPSDAELAIFRIIQECLTNIHRHSGSATARIRIQHEANRVAIQVLDRGKGIPKHKQAEMTRSDSAGVGLGGMRERVRQLGGTFDMKSDENGTVVSAVFNVS